MMDSVCVPRTFLKMAQHDHEMGPYYNYAKAQLLT